MQVKKLCFESDDGSQIGWVSTQWVISNLSDST